MDKVGRRPLLLVPMVVMVLILALITIALKLQVNLVYVSDVMLFYLLHISSISSKDCYSLWNVNCDSTKQSRIEASSLQCKL